ncbi:unnamed protein product [Adineta steineri]|uniref:G-protein coupled receptors family 1 profile domain-containing protein n=1 Tax=Adineta steineri TaxID=433720 RepID=A0A813MQP8_9BILA|nr:unnamed protein product [Adineta steineri]CAF1380390.1 unnamed protein product [Adineta steineri]
MDCFLTYNLSCVNGTFAHFNSSTFIFGDVLHPSVITGDDNPKNDLISSANHPLSSSIFVSIQHCIITTIILGAIILSTITGNIFVIAAVKLEKSLHAVAYYLFVSLAVADLLIATMVMPITLLKEVTRSWILGSFICDAFVTIDLLCCTASILHLVAIALDRYWSITNLDYATKRTPARVLMLICVIWGSSILISSAHLLPIFRDTSGRSPDQCRLMGNVPYTIISTIGAFYIPLIGMCIIYWKIFQAAKFRIRRKAFSSGHSAPTPAAPPPPSVPPPPTTTIQPVSPTQHQNDALLTSNHEISISENTKYQRFSPSQLKKLFKRNPNGSNHHNSHDIETDNPSAFSSSTSQHNHDYQLKSLKKKSSYSLIKSKRGSSIITKTTTSAPVIQLTTTNRLTQEDDEDPQQLNCEASISSTRRLITSSFNNDSPITVNTINNPLVNLNNSPSDSSHITDLPTSKVVTTAVLTNINNTNSHNNNRTVVTKPAAAAAGSHVTRQKKIDIKRERKATKVLGVVMGCFILCWLPFFLEETICGIFHLTINEKVISVLTWLGYLNSLLNPVIYTIFSPDFRKAFKKILFGGYRKRTR